MKTLTHRRKTRAAAAADETELAPIPVATPEELMETLDWRARWFLGISGEEFLSRWFGGYYDADPDQPGVIACAFVAPYVEEYWRARQRQPQTPQPQTPQP
jgi:hypothetical protein